MASETRPDIVINAADGWLDVTAPFSDGVNVSISNNDSVSVLRVATSPTQPDGHTLGYPVLPNRSIVVAIASKLWVKPENGVSLINISGAT